MTAHSGLEEYCREIRRNIVKMACEKKMSHVGSAFSIVEILVSLYFNILRIDPKNPRAKGRDIFILSKGHACLALYNTLAMAGFFPPERLSDYCEFEKGMGGHPDRRHLPGIEACTGALGHGLPIGIGMAVAGRFDAKRNKVVVLMGDGELNEGSVWEGALAAAQYRLDNIVVIIDRNGLQADSRTEDAMKLEPLDLKWKSFGWHVETVDGHNIAEITETLKRIYDVPERGVPNIVIAMTVKGKGVSFMENNQAWHFNIPSKADLEKALKELG